VGGSDGRRFAADAFGERGGIIAEFKNELLIGILKAIVNGIIHHNLEWSLRRSGPQLSLQRDALAQGIDARRAENGLGVRFRPTNRRERESDKKRKQLAKSRGTENHPGTLAKATHGSTASFPHQSQLGASRS
jgi:hypothetical protein